MKRWVAYGMLVGVVGPVIFLPVVAQVFQINYSPWLILSLFPFSIVTMGLEHLSVVRQWVIYGVLAILNITLFAGIGACLSLLKSRFK